MTRINKVIDLLDQRQPVYITHTPGLDYENGKEIKELKMKNIDLNNFVGKNINLILDKADELFNENVEGKIHAHKIYSELLEQVPNIYKKANESGFRGSLRKKIWDCEKFFFWNEKYPSQAGQDKIIKKLFFNNKKEGFFF